MKIINQKEFVPFKQLKAGDVFELEGFYYIRAKDFNGANALKLIDMTSAGFHEDCLVVVYPNAELHLNQPSYMLKPAFKTITKEIKAEERYDFLKNKPYYEGTLHHCPIVDSDSFYILGVVHGKKGSFDLRATSDGNLRITSQSYEIVTEACTIDWNTGQFYLEFTQYIPNDWHIIVTYKYTIEEIV